MKVSKHRMTKELTILADLLERKIPITLHDLYEVLPIRNKVPYRTYAQIVSDLGQLEYFELRKLGGRGKGVRVSITKINRKKILLKIKRLREYLTIIEEDEQHGKPNRNI